MEASHLGAFLETAYEELQSTNEELEMMNEELQSTNDELSTANGQLRQRSEELNHLNTFLESILTSLHQAAVVVDKELLVRAGTGKPRISGPARRRSAGAALPQSRHRH